jgi:CRISPR-associated endoribonuclease Cas6
MRIKILIKAEKIPVIYRHRIVSLIKEALKKSDKDYKEFLYGNKITKPFTFNLVPPFKKEIKEAEIQIDNKFKIKDKVFYSGSHYFSLYISSPDYRFIISLFNGLKRLKIFDFSSYENMLVDGEKIVLQIKNVAVLNERPVKKEEIVFKTNSPIIVEDKNDKPVLFSDKNFERELNEITDRILASSHIKGKGLEKPLRFEPIKMSKQVVKHTLKSFREKTGKPVMYLTGNSGVFKLSGHPKDLEILYKIGIGNRTGQGFGMVEVLG